ncbi:MAG: polysaccharide deacetylase family protein [Eubacterium sp.]
MKIKKRHKFYFKPRFYVWFVSLCVVVTSIVFFMGYKPNMQVGKQIQEVQLAAEAFKEIAIQTSQLGEEKFQSEADKKIKAVEEKIKSGNTNDLKVVFLTFDDGPSEHTAEVLDMLAHYNIKATFFTNGRESDVAMQSYQRIVKDGHVLGNHTYHHNYDLYNNPQAFYNDVKALEDLQSRATGGEKPSKMFRFPGGSLNANATCRKGILERGYNYVDWNVTAGDGGANPKSATDVINRVIGGVHEHHVSTILCHAEQKSVTREALPKIIETLQAEGYTFMTMDATMDIYPRHS